MHKTRTSMQKIQNPFKKKYWLSFIAEWYDMFDQKYKDWGFGRVEVWSDDEQYDIAEWRYCFPPDRERRFYELRDGVEGEQINWFQVQYYKLIVKLFYYRPPK